MPAAVIIGGGVMGASVAWHLARRGWRDITVLDRGREPGTGSTGRATGGFRAQYSTAINVRLSLLSRALLQRFEEDTGTSPGYHPAGYLWLASTEAALNALREAQRVQHAEGLLEAVEVTLNEAVRLNPAVSPEGLAGAVFCPTDGFIRPLQILRGYVTSAMRHGVRFEWGTEVLGLDRAGDGGIVSVRTSTGALPADIVVNACGAWAGALAALAGLDVPVVPLRRQILPTVPTQVLPVSMPMTIFVEDGFHCRVRDGRVLLLRPSPGDPADPFATRVDPSWIDEVAAVAAERLPCLKEVPVDCDAAWAGLYEMSPDRHALVGPHPDCGNLFLINGSSGHGVMHAPALGLLLAEIITEGRPATLDITPLAPDRFVRGVPNPSSGVL
jgi:sarcosine oxidase, subunit beta